MINKPRKIPVSLQVDKPDLTLIDKAAKISGHNRASFIRFAGLKAARAVLRRDKQAVTQ